jgi:hypothetical protein
LVVVSIALTNDPLSNIYYEQPEENFAFRWRLDFPNKKPRFKSDGSLKEGMIDIF